MEIKEIIREDPWEQFLVRQPRAPFLQSWAWGELQDRLGFSHHRFGVYESGALVGVFLAVVGRRKLGSFVYVPYGPVLARFDKGQARSVLEYLKDFAQKEGADYLRIEPPWERGEDKASLLKEAGFRQNLVTTAQGGSGTTWLLDLSLSEEELLAGMRKTTRYLVRRGEEAGIEVTRTYEPREMEELHRLMAVTYRRQRFVPHSRRYLQIQFEVFAPRRIAELSLAKYRGDILAAAVCFSYGDTISYIHAASLHSEVPVSYALMWENIKEAKKDGYRYFDFWGVAETANPHHPWYGYSLFKKGFGGYPFSYVGVWDYPLTPRYYAVWGAEKVRRLIKRT